MITEQLERGAERGHPSYVWRFGQERRLEMVRSHVPLEGRRILDIGCGVGVYVQQFRRLTPYVWGIDVEQERVAIGSRYAPNLVVARGEALPFKGGSFDMVFLHEVLEHVEDDQKTLEEACRVLRPGGHVVIFVPNRFYFFETHGFYLGKRFIFKLLPLINWFPDRIRNVFVPHVRAYTAHQLRGLVRGLPLQELAHTYVYPGFDNIAARRPQLGALLRWACYTAERTPLRVFGLSHFLVLEKRLS